jgi:predicted GIY-YIG superfamily endonuclease
MKMDRDNGRVYVGQTLSPQRRLRQHARSPPLKMRADAKSFKPFEEHFHMDVVYTTSRKYLADKMEKKLIWNYQSEPLKSYNIMRGRPSGDPLYWMLKRKSTRT